MGEQLAPHWATSVYNTYHYCLWGPICVEGGRLLIRNPDDFQSSVNTDLPKLTACTWHLQLYSTPQIKNTGIVMWTVTRLCRASPNLAQVTLMWVWYANKTWSYSCLTTYLCIHTVTASVSFLHWHSKPQTHGAIPSLVSLLISSTQTRSIMTVPCILQFLWKCQVWNSRWYQVQLSTGHSCTAWLQVISAPGSEECNYVLRVLHGGFPFGQVSPPALLPYLQEQKALTKKEKSPFLIRKQNCEFSLQGKILTKIPFQLLWL